MHSDTDPAPDGGGTYASRTAVLGGSAATMAADKIIVKARKIAAHAMEAAEDDIEFSDAIFRVVGTDRAVSLQEVAQAAYVPSPRPYARPYSARRDGTRRRPQCCALSRAPRS